MGKPKMLASDEQIDALHQQIYGDGEAADVEEPTDTAEANEAEPSEPEIDYKQQYDSLQGKYNAELPKLQQELKNTQQMLENLGSTAFLTEMDETAGLTQDEIDEYGEELIDIVKRAARSEFAPVINQLAAQNKELQEKMKSTSQSLAVSARDEMLTTLGQNVPNWQELNTSQSFLDWLGEIDLLSGVPRQQLLTHAFERNDTNRVIAFFRGFTNPEQTGQAPPVAVSSEALPPNGMETLLAPNRPASTAATGAQPSGRIWTTAEIQKLSKDKLSGKISREYAAKIEAEIHQAAMEGRLQ